MAADLTLYGREELPGRKHTLVRVAVSGFTKAGAPVYDFDNVRAIAELPSIMSCPVASRDGSLVLCPQGETFACYDARTGERLWEYPNTFHGVHGSHRAPAPQRGLIRGAFGAIGQGRLPAPVGNFWVINTNVGEWHVLTERGYYLTRLFQGDPLKVRWPERAAPGAVLDDAPPGAGGEDFGGSAVQADDGRVYLQAGKVGLWNVEVIGLDGVRPLAAGRVTVSDDETARAAEIRMQYLQQATGSQVLVARRASPEFTGDPHRDFRAAQEVRYKKQDAASVITAAAWDDRRLYLAWQVRDETPWVNGADAAPFLYARGDTVDFQLATDPKARPDRREAALGDLRLSIGPLAGKPTAVLYRRLAGKGTPMAFSSGVIESYRMADVHVVAGAKVHVRTRRGGYTVEAAIPWKALGMVPKAGLALRADFGVTHGDAAGKDTVLRTYWNNQHTGIVNDEVFELKMEPRNWGRLELKE